MAPGGVEPRDRGASVGPSLLPAAGLFECQRLSGDIEGRRIVQQHCHAGEGECYTCGTVAESAQYRPLAADDVRGPADPPFGLRLSRLDEDVTAGNEKPFRGLAA